MSFLVYIVLFLCAINIKYSVGAQNKLGCRDHKNKIVDWYVLYKIPKLAHSSNPLIRTGSAYMYISNNTVDKGWELSTKDIGDKNSMPGNTLASLYNDKIANNLLWILYNDDPPNSSVVGKYGHAKGVVATDKDQGFWMIHSVPNFPPMPNVGTSSKRRIRTTTLPVDDFSPDSEYSYPSSGHVRGQSFLCISLKANQLNAVGRQLMYNQIIVYRKNLPAKLSNRYPDLTNAANQIRFKNPPYSSKEIIKSSASLEFISFAKSDKWQKDLYSDFVAPQLKSGLFVETYLNGPGKLNSKCQGLEVHNIKSVKLQNGDVQFTSSQDHSKWVVAIDNQNNKSWVCVGDINRADTQYYRGGGTVCLNLFHLWKNYRDSVNDVEPCPLR